MDKMNITGFIISIAVGAVLGFTTSFILIGAFLVLESWWHYR